MNSTIRTATSGVKKTPDQSTTAGMYLCIFCPNVANSRDEIYRHLLTHRTVMWPPSEDGENLDPAEAAVSESPKEDNGWPGSALNSQSSVEKKLNLGKRLGLPRFTKREPPFNEWAAKHADSQVAMVEALSRKV